jgi:hypothetical protein
MWRNSNQTLVSKVTDMSRNLNEDINSWDVVNVTNKFCYVRDLNVHNVRDMSLKILVQPDIPLDQVSIELSCS